MRFSVWAVASRQRRISNPENDRPIQARDNGEYFSLRMGLASISSLHP